MDHGEEKTWSPKPPGEHLFDEEIQVKNQMTWLGVKFTSPATDSKP
jgi:hypothetical protein